MAVQDKLVRISDAVTAIKSLYNVLGVAGTKAATVVLDGLPAAREWISVHDRLPEELKKVLIITNNGNMVVSSYNPNGKHWRFRYPEAITHWLPLPEPPKEEEK